ncbi:MAG: nitric oxide reductase [Nitrospirae bacterium]|nr:nitric oxide reductase [Nitrospirota bacterium]
MTQGMLAVTILGTAVTLLVLGYLIPRMRVFLMSIGFFFFMSGTFASYSNWLPQTRGEVPKEETVSAADFDKMSAEQLADMGSKIIFGPEGPGQGHVGKGQCPLCHGFGKGELSERAPNLYGLPGRAETEVKSAAYANANTIQKEAFSGSGRAASAAEYIAESHSCPHCYVVPGFGAKGTNDRESPMPAIHKPPVSLSIEELIAVDTWFFVREGMDPPSVADLRAAYEKFIPESDRVAAAPAGGAAPAAAAGPPMALGTDTPEQIIMKMGCVACHKIPTTGAKFGAVGPVLILKTNAPKRLASPEYQARVRAGKAHATTPKEYIIESIVHPNAFVVPEFMNKANPEVSPMMQDFSKKFTYEALEKMADFLLTIDEGMAKKEGMITSQAAPESAEESARVAMK